MQTSYTIYTDAGFVGQVYDVNENNVIVSMNNPVDTIKYGRFVQKVAGAERGIEEVDGAGADIYGVAVRDIADSGAGYYAALSSIPVLRKGQIHVEVDQTVTADDAVFCRHTTAAGGTGTDLGVARMDADGGKAVQLTGARFIKGSFADKNGVKIAVVSLNLN